MSDLLVVRDLSVEFPMPRRMFSADRPVVRAVQDVSFSVPRGSCFAIVGESGSGKSTLARAIVGLVRATRGTITLDGQEVTDLTAAELRRMRRRVQMVLQDPRASIDPRMTVYEVLREALVVHGIAGDQRSRIETVIRQVGLSLAHLGRHANALSGGQRQRVAIARAIICEPEILVLDEPVSALDVSIQAQIINLLVELQETLGLTYVMITHDLALVGHFADLTGVMYLGRFVEQGAARSLCEAPAHPYTHSLLSVVASEDPSVEKSREVVLLRGAIPSPLALPSGCAFHTRCPRARLAATEIAPVRTVSTPEGALPRLCVEVRPEVGPAACHFPLGPTADAHRDAPAP